MSCGPIALLSRRPEKVLIPRLLKPICLRPSLLQASLISLCLHAGVVGAVFAVEAWLLSELESPHFGGRRIVVEMALAPSPVSVTEAEETPVIEFTPETTSGNVESSQTPVVSHEPPDAYAPCEVALNRRSSNVMSPLGSLPRPSVERFEEATSRLSPARNRTPHATPIVEQIAHHPPKQTSSVAPPSPAVAAALPAVLGTDDESPPDFAGNRPPAYPPEAYRRRIEGRVLLRLFIAASGVIERVDVLQSSGHAVLDQAALEAVRTWRGAPARRAGEAVATVQQLPVWFRLRD